MPADTLRDYQIEAIERFNDDPHRCPLLVAPTGSGKTVVAASIIKQYASAYKSVIFVVHRREIVFHTSRKLKGLEVPHGIIMAGENDRSLERVQVAAIQTLHARAIRSARMKLPEADLIIVDEAHHSPASTYQKVIAAYPNARVLGLTATPCRGDGRGLGGIFDTLIELPQVPDLIELGFLVKTRTYAPVRPDLKGVGIAQGDYVISQLADRVDTEKMVGDIVTHWHKYGENRKTVVFAVNVAHSIHIRNEFIKAGVRAEHIDGDTPKEQRDEILAHLGRGEIDIICNCMVLTEGWDMPDVGCVILARPTRQMGLYRQMLGRVLRPAPGKTDAIVLDHSGAVFKLGFAEDRIEWTLEPDKRATNKTQESREIRGIQFCECPSCKAIRQGGKPCLVCGYEPPQRRGADTKMRDGDLGLVSADRKAKPLTDDPAEFYQELKSIAQERGYAAGWVAHKFKEKFGHWPPNGYRNLQHKEPSKTTLSWVRSRNIAFAKSRAAA